MRYEFFIVLSLLSLSMAACAPQQPYVVAPQIGDPAQIGEAKSRPVNTSASNADTHTRASVCALPYKGRLVQGDPAELPPAVAAALAKDAPLTFSYREELTHDEYHIPMIFSAIDPVTYFGSPLGDYGVTAFAELTISKGDRVIADYTAKAHVSKSYNLYTEPKHSELELAARDAVRDRIDQKLYADADRVAHSTAAPSLSVPE